jgi:hypothetical protein
MTEKSKHNSETGRKKSLQWHKGAQVARKGQKGPKGPIGPKRPFKHHITDQKQLFTIFDSTSANECLKNESTTRKQLGRSHHRGTRGHKWPERARKGKKGQTGLLGTILLIKNGF